MSDQITKPPTGWIPLSGLVLGIINFVILGSALLYLTKQIQVVQTDTQSSAAVVSNKLQFMEDRLAAIAQQPTSPSSSISVADRTDLLSLLEKTVPSVTSPITVRHRTDVPGFEFTSTLTNTSGILIECTTPDVEMTLDDFPVTETNPNLVAEEAAADVGILAPGASYSTVWYTTETVKETWMQFSGICSPIQVRLEELARLMSAAAIPLDEDILKVKFGGWSSTRGAR
jgi:hypothetical protein